MTPSGDGRWLKWRRGLSVPRGLPVLRGLLPVERSRIGPDVIAGIKAGYVVASFDQVLYLQGFDPVMQIWLTKKYLIPGLHQDTGVGLVTPANVDVIAPLIQQGYR